MTPTPTATSTRPRTFPYKPCGRCGGSGRYSYNLMHGDMCYGCSGKGRAPATKKVAELAASYAAGRRRIVEPHGADLKVGDVIRSPRTREWATVTSLAVTPKVTGWTGTDHTPWAWELLVTFDDGTVVPLATNSILRRRVTKAEIRAELWHLVEEAWASLTPAQRKLVVNPADENVPVESPA